MQNINKFYGNKLKDIRILRGYSLSDISQETGISKQTLSLYENERIRPDFENINILSIFLSVPIQFFFNDISNQINIGSTYFRSLTSSSKKARLQAIKTVEYISHIFYYVNGFVNFPRFDPSLFDLSKNLEFIDIEDEVDFFEDASRKLRNIWNLGSSPIEDMKYLLESNGIIILTANSDEKIDAFSQKVQVNDEEERFVIVINKNQPASRTFFDLAHELGHILFHPWTEDVEALDRDEYKARERQANQFAASFLLPNDEFLDDIQYHSTDLNYYLMLKSKWKVSAQSMIYRSHQLKEITYNQNTYLMKQINYKGYRKREPNEFLYNIDDNLLSSAIELILKNNIVSAQSLTTNTGVLLSYKELEELLNLPLGILQDDNSNSGLDSLISISNNGLRS